MSIRFQCDSCHQAINVKHEFAGRSARCPHCQGKIKVPQQSHRFNADKIDVPTTPVPVLKPLEPDPNPALKQTPGSSDQFMPVGKSTAVKDPSSLMREILAGFHGEFLRVKPTLGYRLAAVVVATVMVMLPLAYLALIGLFAYGLYWHATENIVILRASGIRTGRFAIAVYLGPLVVGVVIINLRTRFLGRMAE